MVQKTPWTEREKTTNEEMKQDDGTGKGMASAVPFALIIGTGLQPLRVLHLPIYSR